MNFTGYNHRDRQIGKPCAYWGLFILSYSKIIDRDKFDENIICLSIYSEITLPFKEKNADSRWVIVFKSFHGYSEGWVDLTIYQDFNCIGMNYIGLTHRCDRYSRNPTNLWSNPNYPTKSTPQSKTCSDYWLIHQSRSSLNPSELENCVFSVETPEDNRIVGSFTLKVTYSVAYNNLSSITGSHETNYFNMTIEADTVLDFPFNTSTEKSVFILKLSTTNRHSFFFNPENSLRVKLNYSGDFEQLMFVIRMQFVENVICKSVQDYHPVDIARMYILNSDTDVYLSSLYPFNGYMIKAMKYTGHNNGSC